MINENLKQVQWKTEESNRKTDHAISILNDVKSATEKFTSFISRKDNSHGSIESFQQSLDKIQHHVRNISFLLKDNQELLKTNSKEIIDIAAVIKDIALNNSHKLDEVEESSQLIEGMVQNNSNKMDDIEKIGRDNMVACGKMIARLAENTWKTGINFLRSAIIYLRNVCLISSYLAHICGD